MDITGLVEIGTVAIPSVAFGEEGPPGLAEHLAVEMLDFEVSRFGQSRGTSVARSS